MSGPKRYTDLAYGLPGIGTSLLAKRLAKLEEGAVLERRRLPPPVAVTVYELAPAGCELAAALGPLITWGLRHAVPETPGDRQFNATWCVLPFWNRHTGHDGLDGPATVAALGAGRRTPGEAAADGAITVDGDLDAASALFAALES